jgi:hypothetical protein
MKSTPSTRTLRLLQSGAASHSFRLTA